MLHLFVNSPFQDCVVHALWTRDFIWKDTFGGGLYQEAVLGVIVHIFVCFLMNVLNIYINAIEKYGWQIKCQLNK